MSRQINHNPSYFSVHVRNYPVGILFTQLFCRSELSIFSFKPHEYFHNPECTGLRCGDITAENTLENNFHSTIDMQRTTTARLHTEVHDELETEGRMSTYLYLMNNKAVKHL